MQSLKEVSNETETAGATPAKASKPAKGNAKPKPDESSSTLDDSPGSGIAFLPVEVQTIGVEEMAVIFRKQERSILRDISQAPDRLPPRLKLPGTRKPLWLVTTVATWLAEHQGSAATSAGEAT